MFIDFDNSSETIPIKSFFEINQVKKIKRRETITVKIPSKVVTFSRLPKSASNKSGSGVIKSPMARDAVKKIPTKVSG